MGYDVRDRYNVGEISVNNPNHIVVTADMTSSTWNTVGSHEVFTVTGGVWVKTWVVCTSGLTSGGSATIHYGHESYTTLFANAIAYGGFATGEFIDTSNNASVAYLADGHWFGVSVGDRYAWLYGQDVGYSVNVAALTGGTLEFHCIWQPLTVGATVVAGSGGSL